MRFFSRNWQRNRSLFLLLAGRRARPSRRYFTMLVTSSQALTIPHLTADGNGNPIGNLRFRLLWVRRG